MFLPTILAIVGLALLVGGADLLVRGASTLALGTGVRSAVVGLTVVAWGTSFPELVISVDAALRDLPDIAVANVVGSNLYNIALILGVAGLISGLNVAREAFRIDIPALLGATVLAVVLVQDGRLGPVDGGVLLGGLVAVTAAWLVDALRKPADATDEAPRSGRIIALSVLGCVGGVLLLGVGARLFTSGAVSLAELLGVSRRVIGLTLVALGTSLPELFTSVVAAARGEADIAVSNVVGSCIFNLLAILGLTAVLSPIAVDPAIVGVDAWWMLGLTVLLVPLLWTESRLTRLEGVVLLGAGIAYTSTLL